MIDRLSILIQLFATNAVGYHIVSLSIGLCVAIPSQGQSADPITQSIEEQLVRIEASYYYTDLDSALRLYQQVAHQTGRYERWDLQLKIYLQMAWCADYHSALDTLQYYLERAKKISALKVAALDTLDEQQSIRLMIPYTEGIYYYAVEDFQQSIQSFFRIVSPSSPAFDYDSMLVFGTYSYIGQAYYENANYHQASAYHQRAIQWLPRATFQSNIRNYYYYQAINYLYLGQCYLSEARYENKLDAYRLARDNISVALELLRKHPNDAAYQNSLSAAYEQLAEWHRLQQHYDSALWYSNRALRLYSEGSQQQAFFYIGRTYAEKGNYQKALNYLRQSLEGLAADQTVKAAASHLEIGTVYARQGQWNEAILSYQESLSLLVDPFEPKSIFENPSFSSSSVRQELLNVLIAKANALAEKSKISADTLELLAAFDTYQRAVEAIDQMRQTFPSLAYKQFLSAQSATLYEQAIRASLRAHELGLTQKDFLAEAFYFSEKGKAATLLEAVRTSEARSFADIPAALLEQENELKRKLTYWENELYQAHNDSSRQVLRNRAFETREAYNSLVKQLEEEYPNYYQLKYDTKVTNLAQLQATLPRNAVLLSFSYGDSTLYTFTVRADAVHYHTVPLDSTFHRRLENVLQTISRYDYRQAGDLSAFQQFADDAHQLYRTLIQPSLDAVAAPVEQLIIIPDGLLGYLPFDVLLTEMPTTTQVNYQQLSYLVKQLPVSYEYSATLLTMPSPPQHEVPYSYAGFAPSYSEAPLADSREVRTTLDGQLLGLGKLRYNREEVAYASDLFDGKTFAGEAATEAQFKQYAGQSRLLHLSMHAYAHDENDDFSGLIFTQQADTVQEDGFLHSNELYNLSLNAELAVLSACETGIGTLAPGEGIMSLGRAFKYAGCPNVTMSLWKADDQSTNRIMQHFFTGLREDQPKDQALRQAKLTYLDQAKSAQAHPYYWAAFVQVGSSQPLVAGDNSSWWWWMTGGLAVLFLLMIGMWFLGKNQSK